VQVNDSKLRISRTENKFLNSLVTDCSTFHLSTQEALEYIETKYKRISPASYFRRRAFLESDHSVMVWLNNFCKIGFVQLHKELVENVHVILEDSNKRLVAEENKVPRNEGRILRLKADIRESVNLLSELGLGTPIVAQIRAKLAEKEQRRIIPIQMNAEDSENENESKAESNNQKDSVDTDSNNT
jgi:hypothetical protein